MDAKSTFREKAPWIMALLIRDFDLAVDHAAAILGNLGHESGGLVSLQEVNPTVAGSKGGYGWAQWTGPRRRDFMAYCERNHFSPASDQANYKWLFLDLSGDYKNAIAAVKKAKTLADKVKAFELAFERAGVKHYDLRNQWAARALDAWHACGGKPTLPTWALPIGRPVTPVEPVPAPEPVHAPEPIAAPPLQPAPTPAGQPGIFVVLLSFIAKLFERKA
jgi:Phage tail lysozyme